MGDCFHSGNKCVSHRYLEKIDTSKPCVVDENFTVLLGKCSNTKKTYLVKYAKHLSYIEGLESIDMKATDFKLVGAYPVDEETYNSLSDGKSNRHINTMSLRGVPTCPCCGALTDRLQPVLGVERKALSAKLRKVVWT